MRATKVLTAQHRAIEKLFTRVLAGRGDRVELVAELGRHVLTHMIVEQTIFYPAVLALQEDFVLDSYEEHAVCRFQLRRLLGTTAEGPRLSAKVRTLQDLVLRHVAEEEQTLFPRVDKALDEARNDALRERLLIVSEDLLPKDLDVLLLRSKKSGSVDAAQEAAA